MSVLEEFIGSMISLTRDPRIAGCYAELCEAIERLRDEMEDRCQSKEEAHRLRVVAAQELFGLSEASDQSVVEKERRFSVLRDEGFFGMRSAAQTHLLRCLYLCDEGDKSLFEQSVSDLRSVASREGGKVAAEVELVISRLHARWEANRQ